MVSDIKYLASDELEGRGVGTQGLVRASEYLAEQFAKAGLKTDLFDGTPYQTFRVPAGVERGPKERNTLTFVGPPAKEGEAPQRLVLELEKDFQSLALGGAAKFDAPVVFVGYGITVKEKYDEYADLDVKGKIVVLIRREPQQGDEKSIFDGTRASSHALFNRKIANASEHGAAAVIMVNDSFGINQQRSSTRQAWSELVQKLVTRHEDYKKIASPTEEDTRKYMSEVNRLSEQIKEAGEQLSGDFDAMPGFQEAGLGPNAKVIPVLFAKRAAVEPMLKAAGVELAQVEQQIDQDLKPASRELAGWKAVGETDLTHRQADIRNVIGVIEGEGPLADETIVIGAHYDHVGLGGPGSGSLAAPWTTDVHNGADDNASGTTALLQAARYFAQKAGKPKRRLVFIAFSGEERGLLGSAHYVKQPRFPLDKTIAMVNMDMVGRLTDNKLIVYGTGTAASFDGLIDELNKQHQFAITKHPEGFGPSDHSSFYAKQIPVFHFFTGTHKDYHRPSDDWDLVNIEGMRRIASMVTEVVEKIDTDEKRPEYREVKGSAQIARSGDRPYFGSIPDFAQEGEGYALMGVTKGGPADRAGLKSGDIIIKLGESKITTLDDFDSALRKFKTGDKVPVTVKRGQETLTLPVTLAPPR